MRKLIFILCLFPMLLFGQGTSSTYFPSDNIYNSDGTLTAERTLSGNGDTLNFTGLGRFAINPEDAPVYPTSKLMFAATQDNDDWGAVTLFGMNTGEQLGINIVGYNVGGVGVLSRGIHMEGTGRYGITFHGIGDAMQGCFFQAESTGETGMLISGETANATAHGIDITGENTNGGYDIKLTTISSNKIGISGHTLPFNNVTWDLGTALLKWRKLYVSDINASGLVQFSGLPTAGSADTLVVKMNANGDISKQGQSSFFSDNSAVVLLDSITTVGTETEIDFTLPAGYKTFKIQITGLVASVDGYLQMFVDNGGGWLGSYQVMISSSSYGGDAAYPNLKYFSDTALTSILLTNQTVSANANRPSSGTITIQNAKQAGIQRRTFKSEVEYFDDAILAPAVANTWHYVLDDGSSWVHPAATLTQVRILLYSGVATPTDGDAIGAGSNFRIYGYK